ncbi:hypothetical protein DFP73DRAFT_524770 [Morchella snyderi]|nr:hypothetical protein DFP73DRAFT_524770 [Morchella snyderi]
MQLIHAMVIELSRTAPVGAIFQHSLRAKLLEAENTRYCEERPPSATRRKQYDTLDSPEGLKAQLLEIKANKMIESHATLNTRYSNTQSEQFTILCVHASIELLQPEISTMRRPHPPSHPSVNANARQSTSPSRSISTMNSLLFYYKQPHVPKESPIWPRPSHHPVTRSVLTSRLYPILTLYIQSSATNPPEQVLHLALFSNPPSRHGRMGAILTLLVVLIPWARPFPPGLTHAERKPTTATANERPQLEKEACGRALEGRGEEYKSTDKLGWSAYLEDARESELYGAGL